MQVKHQEKKESKTEARNQSAQYPIRDSTTNTVLYHVTTSN